MHFHCIFTLTCSSAVHFASGWIKKHTSFFLIMVWAFFGTVIGKHT